MIASAQIIGKIKASVKRGDGNYVYRGTAWSGSRRGEGDEYEIWDDMTEQRTYHVLVGEIKHDFKAE